VCWCAAKKMLELELQHRTNMIKRNQDGQQQAELKKTLQKFIKLCVNIIS
jgi:hypothetical protein